MGPLVLLSGELHLVSVTGVRHDGVFEHAGAEVRCCSLLADAFFKYVGES